MTRLDIALRRATDAVVPDTAGELTSDVVSDLPELVGGAEPQARFPPDVESQLANLVQALDLHPDKPRIVAFVASGRGAGTTTCVGSVGSYLASRGATVLMVDANLHRPGLQKAAKVEGGPGLVELMSGEIDLKAAVKPADVPGLFVLTTGQRQPINAGALLRPPVLRERLLRHTTDYDYVLVDCPAVNAYEEAAMTAAACDGVILVVEGGRTPREEAQASKAILTRVHCKMLGVFMNKRRFYVPKFLYDRL